MILKIFFHFCFCFLFNLHFCWENCRHYPFSLGQTKFIIFKCIYSMHFSLSLSFLFLILSFSLSICLPFSLFFPSFFVLSSSLPFFYLTIMNVFKDKKGAGPLNFNQDHNKTLFVDSKEVLSQQQLAIFSRRQQFIFSMLLWIDWKAKQQQRQQNQNKILLLSRNLILPVAKTDKLIFKKIIGGWLRACKNTIFFR